MVTNFMLSQHIPYKYHGVKGRHEIDYAYRKTFNVENNRYEFIKFCRRLIWIKRQYSGKIYYYDELKESWYTKEESGYFWYCYWSSWNKC
jgi:hypothetical protein